MTKRWKPLVRIAFGVLPLVGVLASMLWVMRHGLRSGSTAFIEPFSAALVGMQIAWFVLQAVLWLRYKPFATISDEEAPFLSVIIPAYNEGPMIERSIESVANADYPAAKLEIIVVDDGSRDDTYFHMERMRRKMPGRVRLLRFRGNRGKRAGLQAGFLAARGEVVLTLDSDSEITPGTLKAMVAPLVRDARVGAVAGRVSVLNRGTMLGRMLEVQYALAFDFGRAAQSAYRTVSCCPGALSAFRRAIILPHLESWLDQQFLGRPVSHGEDQALTNIVLRAGYDTVYQRTAVVNTLAPQRHRQLFRMLTRWDRSYIVEGFSFARFMFGRYRNHNRILPALHFVISNLRLVLFYAGIVMLPALVIQRPSMLGDFVVAFLLGSTFTAAYYLESERSFRFLYGVAYAVYAFFLLQWTLPWALLTVRDERWGTR